MPIPSALGPYSEAELENLSKTQEEGLTQTFKLLQEEVISKQAVYDKKMVQEYFKRRDIPFLEVRFNFEAGDQVLLKQKEPGKMKCRALGPYTFIKYTGRLGVTAEILNAKGKVY